MDNDDGLDIPEFLRRTGPWKKIKGYRHTARMRHHRKTAKEKRFYEYARRKAKRRRATFEWR